MVYTRGVSLRALLWASLFLVAPILACGGKTKQAGGLEVIIATDMPTPATFGTVNVKVQQQVTADGIWGPPLLERDYVIPSEMILPTTVAVVAGASSYQEVLITVTGLAGEGNSKQAIVQRVVRTQVPTDKLLEVLIVLSSNCLGKVRCPMSEDSCQPDLGICGPGSPPPLAPFSPLNLADAGLPSTVADAGDSDAWPDATMGNGDAGATTGDGATAPDGRPGDDAAPFCDGAGMCGVGVCVMGACQGVCTPGDTRCSANSLQKCDMIGAWGAATACGAHQSCTGGGSAGAAACTCVMHPTCTPAAAAGPVCSGATTLVTCSQDTQGCWYASATSTCGGACLGGPGTAQCFASSVLQFHNHANRDGFFVDSAITKTAATTLHKDTTFDGTITGNVFVTPLYVANGAGQKGAFYVATESNDVYALDEVTGKPVWHRTLGPPVSGLACGNIKPLGVTGTPAIDLGTRTIVMDAAIAGMGGAMTHSAFGLSIDDGSVRWSLDLSTVKDSLGNAFGATKTQNQRSAVLVVGGKAYFAFGGHFGDCGVYYGWVIGVPLDGNSTNVRAWKTQVQGAAIWGPGGPASDGMSVFVTTGNGFSISATPAESEGLLRLGLDLSFTNTNPDFFTPADWKALDNNDLDLGSSGPLLIDAPSIMPSALAMAAGKDGKLYLLDRNNLGGVAAATLGTALMSSGSFIQAGAWANLPGGTFVVVRGGAAGVSCPMGTMGNLIAVRLDPAAQNRMSTVWCADSLGAGSPIISTSDGTNDALVWSAGAEVSNALHAWDLHTGQLVFGGGGAGDAIPNVRHYSSPIVANGRVVVAGDGYLYAFKP